MRVRLMTLPDQEPERWCMAAVSSYREAFC